MSADSLSQEECRMYVRKVRAMKRPSVSNAPVAYGLDDCSISPAELSRLTDALTRTRQSASRLLRSRTVGMVSSVSPRFAEEIRRLEHLLLRASDFANSLRNR
jgi:hypothetical protein